MNNNRWRGIGVVAVALCVLGANGFGAPLDVRIDFNTVATSPGGNWNTIGANVAGAVLTDFNSGADSGARLTLVGWGFTGGGSAAWQKTTPTWLDANQYAAKDRCYQNYSSSAKTGTITVAGLDNSKKYTVELIAAENTVAVVAPATFTLGTDTRTFNIKSDGYTAGNWMTWSGVSPSASQVTITAVADAANERISANALRILVEPLPSGTTILIR